jgi:predicted XRE-type DNA-binding protein
LKLQALLQGAGVDDGQSVGRAIKVALVEQINDAIAEEGLSKAEIARRMRTSRPSVDRLLDPANEGVTLGTLQKVARAIGRDLRLELIRDWLESRPLESAPHAVPIAVFSRTTTTRQPRTRSRRVRAATFFEVTPAQIQALDQNQLVELLRKLVAAELLANAVTLRAARVAAQINIPDGGEDGRVDWQGGSNETEYLPSRFCIFQSKAGNPTRAKLQEEVWAKKARKAGERPKPSRAVVELLERSGSYVVVTATPIVGQEIRDRVAAIEQAMREAGCDPDALHAIEIYDANALSDWVSVHPGVALWLNETLRHVDLGGFQAYDGWGRSLDVSAVSYVDDDQPRFRRIGASANSSEAGASSHELVKFGVAAADAAAFLAAGGRAVRIVGTSGYGKTRFAFELFSKDRTKLDRLDPEALVFASYEDVKTRLGAIALDLADGGAPTILVVDDCPDEVHRDLAAKARRSGSLLRVVTTDVETRCQNTAQDLVVEVGAASTTIVEDIAKQVAPSISGSDVGFVRDLADGFPRMALLAAQAISDGYDPLGTVDELIDRIVWGRSSRDPNTERILALTSFFTVVGVDADAASELKTLSAILGTTAADSYQRLDLMRPRGVILRRGDFIEVPLPLAARLAARLLESQPREWLAELFSAIPSQQMQFRFLERLRWLDRSENAQRFADRLLEELRTLDDLNNDRGAKLLDRLLHVAPDKAMAVLQRSIGNLSTAELRQLADRGRRYVVFALEKLVFRGNTFVAAATLLRRLGAAETENRISNNASGTFKELYQLYLSGTEAPPEERLRVIDDGLSSSDEAERTLCVEALGTMLKRHHFTRSGGAEQIGSAAPLRDWEPKVWGDVFDYHRSALSRLLNIACSGDKLAPQAQALVESHVREILSLPALFDDVRDAIARITASNGFSPRAVFGVNAWLFFDRREAPDDYSAKVRALYDTLVPADVVDRVLLFTTGWQGDLYDPDVRYDPSDNDHEYSVRQSVALAEIVAAAGGDLLYRTLSKVTTRQLHGVFSFSRRLTECVGDPIALLHTALRASSEDGASVLETRFFSGLIAGAETHSHATAVECAKIVLGDARFEGVLASMIGSVRIDEELLAIVVELLREKRLNPSSAATLSYGRGLDHLPPKSFEAFLDALIEMGADGCWSALDVVAMYQHGRPSLAPDVAALFKKILVSRRLFETARAGQMGGHHFEQAVQMLSRQGYLDCAYAADLTERILALGTDAEFELQLDLDDSARKVLKLLIADFPAAVWQKLQVLFDITDGTTRFRMANLFQMEDAEATTGGLLSEFPREILMTWFRENPSERMEILLGWLPIVEAEEGSRLRWNADLEQFLSEHVTRPEQLSVIASRFHPRSWWGSLADRLEPFLSLLREWWGHPNGAVRSWAIETHERLTKMIAEERRRDANDRAARGF